MNYWGIVFGAVASAGIALAVPPVTASAHSFYWWEFPRKVVVTKNTTIEKIKTRYPLYKSRPVKYVELNRGDIITVSHLASYDWSVQKKGFANNSNYFWVMNSGSKPNWILPYSKHHLMSTKKYDGYFTNTNGNGWIYTKPDGKKSHRLSRYSKTQWHVTKKGYTENGAMYYYVTSRNKRVSGWVWNRYLQHDYTQIFKYANWQPYHIATNQTTFGNGLTRVGFKPGTDPVIYKFKIGENVMAQKYSSRTYLVKADNGTEGFFSETADQIIPGHLSGAHNDFIKESQSAYTTGSTAFYETLDADTFQLSDYVGTIPNHTKIYIVDYEGNGKTAISYNDHFGYISYYPQK